MLEKQKMFKHPQKVVENMANEFFKELEGKTFSEPIAPASNPVKLGDYIKKSTKIRKSLECNGRGHFGSEDDRTAALMQKRENLSQLVKKISKKLEKSQSTFQKIQDIQKLQEYQMKLLEISRLLIDFPAQTQTFQIQSVINIIPSSKCNYPNFKTQRHYQHSDEQAGHTGHKIDLQEIRSRLKLRSDYNQYHPNITTNDDTQIDSKYLIDKSKLLANPLAEDDKKSNSNLNKKQLISKQMIKQILSDNDPLSRTINTLNAQIALHNSNNSNLSYENLKAKYQTTKTLTLKNSDKKQNSFGPKTNYLKSPRFLMQCLKNNDFPSQIHRYQRQH